MSRKPVPGTGKNEPAPRHGNAGGILYIIIFLLLCLIPSAGLLFGAEGAREKEDSAKFPSLQKDGGAVNERYLQQAGDWFQDHFALRQQLVTANAKLRAGLFQESAAEGVILGTDGWLYYRDSLADYQGTDLLSDRALYDIAHTAAMTQDYLSLLGINYLFALAPNKATVYPEHMPYYLKQKASDESNRQRLMKYMQEEGVSYADLSGRLVKAAQSGEERALPALYHKRDSHWTAEGAAFAADEILTQLGVPHRDYSKADYSIRTDFTGDLEQMLYPAAPEPEEEVSFEPAPSYGYPEEVESTFDFFIHTVSGGEGESLVMYRDSFGNAILPFMAEAFGTAYFTRGTPYTLTDLYTNEASDAVFLRAERFLPEIAALPPVLEAFPSSEITGEEEGVTETDASLSCAVEDANPYYSRIEGILLTEPASGERIFVDPGDGYFYEAMPVHRADGREGFVMYLPQEKLLEMENVKTWKVFYFV